MSDRIVEKIDVYQGDITKVNTDAIVNAANETLLGGGGVDGAIHRAAGPELLEACRALNGCAAGEAKITDGYKLSAKYVIHTVGPIWSGGDKGECEVLRRAYQSSLDLAVQQDDIKSIAFPAISTGAYRFPLQRAAEIAVTSVYEFVKANPHFERILFVCFDEINFEIYSRLLKEIS